MERGTRFAGDSRKKTYSWQRQRHVCLSRWKRSMLYSAVVYGHSDLLGEQLAQWTVIESPALSERALKKQSQRRTGHVSVSP